MWEKRFDYKIDFMNDSDKMLTCTTDTDNFEVNENDTFFSNTEGSQIIYETNSDIDDKELSTKKTK